MIRGSQKRIALALLLGASACGRMSQSGCVGDMVATVRNRSGDTIEVLQDRGEFVLGVVPPRGQLDFVVPPGTRRVLLRFQRRDAGSGHVPPEMATVGYSCR